MATSSIFHHVHIIGEQDAKSFLDAVDASEKAVAKIKPIPTKIKELKTKEEVSAFFAKYKG